MNRRRWWIVGACAVVALAAGLVAFRLFGGSAPDEVSLSTSSPRAATGATGATGAVATGGGSGEGAWVIDTATGSFEDFSSTFAGYRIDEEISGIGANTAVGRTPDVSGTMAIDGTTITAMSIEVDMTTLRSDDDRRDGQLAERGLETNAFPTAAFELTEPIELGAEPVVDEPVSVTAVGELTLHSVTKVVEVPIEAQLTDAGLIEAVASFRVKLADHDIEPPVGFLVLSIADRGTIELRLLWAPA
jgi:polyisoprenoid-binding protein YceI